MTAKYILLALDAGLCIAGVVPPPRNPIGSLAPAERPKHTLQRSLPPHGAQPEQLAEGEDELERARR